MKALELFAAIVGLAAGCLFLITALRAFGELAFQGVDPYPDEVPPADHPYEPNGGRSQAGPHLAIPPAALMPTGLCTTPGRGKDNDADRDAADRSHAG